MKNRQRRLDEVGWSPPLHIDGKSGPRSGALGRWFQTNHGLTADGIVGNRTWRRLVDSQRMIIDVGTSDYLIECLVQGAGQRPEHSSGRTGWRLRGTS
ncbi:peptidoglycan-binding domain-containing protein [Streptomyces griseorubiginosus]|uniref:peptidoglycan-binding domain-containing protein n=1 Tax=Streptomyces griseorubiginosus TaxID=67304 RepID=UPI003655E76C